MYYILTPQLEHRITFHSNLHNTGNSDVEHRSSAQVLLDGENERNKFKLGAGVDYYWYHDRSEANRWEPYAGLNSIIGLNETAYLRLDGQWRKDYTLSGQLEETGENTIKTERYRWSVSPGISFRPTERDTHHITYTYSTTDYEGTRYADNVYQGVDWSWDHYLTERLVGMVRAFVNQTDVDFEGGESDMFRVGVQVGPRYDLTETLTVLLVAGPTWGRTNYNSTALDASDSKIGYSATASIDWQMTELSKSSLTYSRSSTTATTGGFLDQDRLQLVYFSMLTEYTWLRLSGTYLHSQSWGFGDKTETSLYRVGGVYHWNVTKDFSIELGASWTESVNEITSKSNDDTACFIEFVQEFPWEL